MFAVKQVNENGAKPFKVQLSGSSISGGNGGVVFSNIGGELTLENVIINSSNLMSLSSTGSSSQGDEGSTFLRGITVMNSTIMVSRFLCRITCEFL